MKINSVFTLNNVKTKKTKLEISCTLGKTLYYSPFLVPYLHISQDAFPPPSLTFASRVDVSKCFNHSISCVQIGSKGDPRASMSLLLHKAFSKAAKAEGSCRIRDRAAVA